MARKRVAKTARSPKASAALMVAPKSGVNVRMYRQGLGDCFLLALPGRAGKPFYMLIDCGVVVGQVKRRPGIRDVVQDISASTGGHLDLIVATHQHWDHLSGFVDANDIFKRMKIDQVWLAWTEDPSDELARRLGEKNRKLRTALHAVAGRLKNGGASPQAGAGWGAALENVLGFLGADANSRSTDAAIGALTQLCAARPRFCRPSDPPQELPGVPDVKIYILGPPHDEQKIRRYNDKKTDPQTYRVSEMALEAQADFLLKGLGSEPETDGALPKYPFDLRHCVTRSDSHKRYRHLSTESFGGRNQWRRVTLEWLRAASGLALHLDNATNNTSLALAIEIGSGGKVLLFPADAQVGNWLSWHDQSWKGKDGAEVTASDLLARTVLYKVGHHGSHNATLRQRGLELMKRDELIAICPLDRATAVKKKWPMPWPKLRKNLLEATHGRTIQVDDKQLPRGRQCPKGTQALVWKKFQRSVTGGDLYFEIAIS